MEGPRPRSSHRPLLAPPVAVAPALQHALRLATLLMISRRTSKSSGHCMLNWRMPTGRNCREIAHHLQKCRSGLRGHAKLSLHYVVTRSEERYAVKPGVSSRPASNLIVEPLNASPTGSVSPFM